MKTSAIVLIAAGCFVGGSLATAFWLKAGPGQAAESGGEAKATRSHERPAERIESPAIRERRAEIEKRVARGMKYEEKLRAERELYLKVKPWVDDALQWNDPALREAAIGKIREAMANRDPATVLLGMKAFTSLYEVDLDKASFRAVIIPHLDSPDETLRRAAWGALQMSGFLPEDAEHARRIARQGGMGEATVYFLARLEKGDLTGESGKVVEELLDSATGDGVKSVLGGLSGVKLSPALESRVLAMSLDPDTKYDAVYQILSTQLNKSEAVVKRLIEVMNDQNEETSGRAAWGLHTGLPPEMKPVVAEAALKIVPTRASGYAVSQAWRLLEENAGPEQLEGIRELAAKPGLKEEQRQTLERLIKDLESTGK